jgi:hypothetical protein
MRQCDDDPLAAIVMRVSVGGKSTIGQQLANRLGWTFAGRCAAPARNVAKLTSGQPLTGIGRAPWLAAVAVIETWRCRGGVRRRHLLGARSANARDRKMPEIVMSIIGVLLSAARKPQ